ncbi:hypothetical protein NM688_g4084 [Phlebia brevispora]|uniref:Uncharacterized protein n=1 Tax=Phlebia brevispora TaxID=194682 RepID=A0ACC1T429_9APHY|nr:hypothetical protein NM688_g4084 [Phlebia brevispora]
MLSRDDLKLTLLHAYGPGHDSHGGAALPFYRTDVDVLLLYSDSISCELPYKSLMWGPRLWPKGPMMSSAGPSQLFHAALNHYLPLFDLQLRGAYAAISVSTQFRTLMRCSFTASFAPFLCNRFGVASVFNALAMAEEKTPRGSLELAPDRQPSPAPAALPLPVSSSTATSTSTPCDFFFVPVPKYLRHNPDKPAPFSLFLNIIFAIATTFIVANIYWCQPILIELSLAFNVSYDRVSNVPTLMQAGYAAGLLFIAPLGDLVRRRPLILLLTIISIALTFGVAFTTSFVAFEILSFFIGVMTCVPQILIPLAADLAPPAKRASAISIVISGLLLGILIARVLSGLVAQFVSWRVVYYLAIGLQAVIFAMLYFLLPDFPVRNQGLTYWAILRSMAKFSVTEPLLIQACLVCMASMACFSNFWVTLTFLLGGEPYNYSTLVIGLFGLVGMFGVLIGPLVGRAIDRLVPWVAAVIATVGLLVFQAIQTGAGGINIAAVIIVCFGIDLFRQMQQVALQTAVFGIDATARSRLNAIVLIMVFVGQIMGTAVGTKVFVEFGWRPAAALSVGWSGFTLIVMLLRGPHCSRYTWLGYQGGLRMRKLPPEDVSKVVVRISCEPAVESRRSMEKDDHDDPDLNARISTLTYASEDLTETVFLSLKPWLAIDVLLPERGEDGWAGQRIRMRAPTGRCVCAGLPAQSRIDTAIQH